MSEMRNGVYTSYICTCVLVSVYLYILSTVINRVFKVSHAKCVYAAVYEFVCLSLTLLLFIYFVKESCYI